MAEIMDRMLRPPSQPRPESWVVAVHLTGTPGVGKTVFGTYLMVEILQGRLQPHVTSIVYLLARGPRSAVYAFEKGPDGWHRMADDSTCASPSLFICEVTFSAREPELSPMCVPDDSAATTMNVFITTPSVSLGDLFVAGHHLLPCPAGWCPKFQAGPPAYHDYAAIVSRRAAGCQHRAWQAN